jgi:hypothetical protein
MKVQSLSGKLNEIEDKPSKFPMKNKDACRSNIQYECGQIIKSFFGFDCILEDVPVPDHNFYLDFFLPNRKLAFEVQGRQHDEFVPFFHKNKKGFQQAQQRDSDKAKWCRVNNIELFSVHSTAELKELFNG